MKDRIEQDYKIALRQRDILTLAVLRLLKSAISAAETSQKTRRALSDAEIIEVIQRQVKQRKESVEQYRAAGRNDLADIEAGEMSILENYLPEQLDRETIEKLVKEIIVNIPLNTLNKGMVMKELMPKIKGKADGKLVNEIVTEQLLLAGLDAK